MHNIDFARFPIKLHRILEMASNDPELSNVICWLPGGYAFVIKDQLAFSHIVLPIHFASMHSFKSFRRQLNLYGFKKQYNKVSGKRGKNNLLATMSIRNKKGSCVFSPAAISMR